MFNLMFKLNLQPISIRILKVAFLGTLLPTLVPSPMLAVPLGNGKTAFEQTPRLIRVAASSRQAGIADVTYEFTISVPQDAGEPLQTIAITQPQNPQLITFKPAASRAFTDNQEISLANLGGTQLTNNEVSIAFNPPLSPGKIVTVRLKPERNPTVEGIYLFGVTAYPKGEGNTGLSLGYGRLTFYQQQGTKDQPESSRLSERDRIIMQYQQQRVIPPQE